MDTMGATITITTYNYQATCQHCHWTSTPQLMKHRAQDAANTHNALWHVPATCSA